jgi:catalase-peroxidase
MGKDFDYAEEFKSLDLAAVKKDLAALMTDSQDWWPADFGHYGPLFIRMAWHSAGTYRIGDGRGGAGRGQQRFAPLNSWPDNVSLDKARRLLWPIKQKYGRKISWADLMILTGNVALETMGFKTFGFGGGRPDVWEPDQDVYWGREKTWLGGDVRYAQGSPGVERQGGVLVKDDDSQVPHSRDLENPLAAVQMGLIYVNPEGPDGKPDPLAAAATSATPSAHGDERRGNRGADRGRPHLRQDARRGPASTWPTNPKPPASKPGPRLEEQLRHRQGRRHHHQRPGSDLDHHAHQVEQQLLREPVRLRMGTDEEPGRRAPVGGQAAPRDHPACARPRRSAAADDAHHRPVAALRPGLREDLAPLPGEPRPVRRCLRPRLVQADPPRHGSARALPRPGSAGRRTASGRTRFPAVDHPLVDAQDVAALKQEGAGLGPVGAQLVSTAWASASTFRGSDKRGGANGARIRLAPQKDWAVNQPEQLAKVLQVLEGIRASSTARSPAARRSRWPT